MVKHDIGQRVSLVGLLSALVMGVSPIATAEDVIGKDEFQKNCAACHGVEGLGNGPVAELLKTPPPNLQLLSKNNDGKFPFMRVFHTIDGRQGILAHGTREMPIWGQRYEVQGEDYGPYGTEAFVRGRILELVYYIQSLQAD